MRRRGLVAVVALVVAGSAVTATGAVVSGGDDLLAPAEAVELRPAPGPNGAYARFDGDRELRVAVDGAPADGRTVLRRVFLVANTGDDTVWVWLADDSPAVDYRVAGCELTRVDPCRVAGGGRLPIGVAVDTDDDTAILTELTVHALVAGADETDPNATVERAAEGVRVRVDETDPTEPVTADVNVTGEGGDVTVDAVTVNTTRETSLSLTVVAGANRSAVDVDTPPANATGDPVGYVRVDHAAPETAFRNVTFEVAVARERLAAVGVAPGAVRLARLHDGAWTRLPTTVVARGPETVRLRARAPGVSALALVGVDTTSATGGTGVTGGDSRPPTAAASAPSTVAAGETVVVDASETADDEALVRYRWDTDDDGATEVVTGDPTLYWTPERPGTRTLRVVAVDENGLTDATTVAVSVTASVSPTATPESTPTATPESTPTRSPTAVSPTTTDTASATTTDTASATTTDTASATATDTASATATDTASATTTDTASVTTTDAPVTEPFGFPAEAFTLLAGVVLLVGLGAWYRSRR